MGFHPEKAFKSMMTFTIIMIAAIALNAQSVFEVEVTPKMNTQKSGAVVEIQEDNKPALIFGESGKPQSMMFFWLKKRTLRWKKATHFRYDQRRGFVRKLYFRTSIKKRRQIHLAGGGRSQRHF